MSEDEGYVDLGNLMDEEPEVEKKGVKEKPMKKTIRKKKFKKPESPAEAGPPEKTKAPQKPAVRAKDNIKTDVDKLYELVRERGIIKMNVASKKLGIEEDQIEEWGRILEDHNLIKLHYPPVGEPIMILKKFKSEVKEIEKVKKKARKPGKRVFMINIMILLGFIAVVSFYMFGGMKIRISPVQIYLALPVIIIIAGVLVFKFRKAQAAAMIKRVIRRRHDKKEAKKGGKTPGKKK